MNASDKIWWLLLGWFGGSIMMLVAMVVSIVREALIRERESREVPHDRG